VAHRLADEEERGGGRDHRLRRAWRHVAEREPPARPAYYEPLLPMPQRLRLRLQNDAAAAPKHQSEQ